MRVCCVWALLDCLSAAQHSFEIFGMECEKWMAEN